MGINKLKIAITSVVLVLQFVIWCRAAPQTEDHIECIHQFNSDTGKIEYPETNGYYPNQVNCTWVIVSSGDSIELEFTKFDTEYSYDFIYIRDGENSSSPLLGKYSGDTLPSIVRTTSNKAFIGFSSDDSKANTGFILNWKIVEAFRECGKRFNSDVGIIEYPETSLNYLNNANCSWVIATSGPRIELTFTRIQTESSYDFVYIRDGESNSDTLIGNYSGNILQLSVTTTCNKAFVGFSSDHSKTYTGFTLSWQTFGTGTNVQCLEDHIDCTQQFNKDTGMIEYPETNGYYPNQVNCSWVIVSSGDSIELDFTMFDTEYNYDFVYIRDGENSSSPLLGKYSGDTLPSIVRTTSNKAFIGFSSDDSNANTGFILYWKTVEAYRECGKQFNSDYGIIEYPETSLYYPNNANCSWVIATSGPRIELTFTSIETESSHDFVYIRDGESNSDTLLGNYSGNILQLSVDTTSNKAFIGFSSDHSKAYTGFILSWKTFADSSLGVGRPGCPQDEFIRKHVCIQAPAPANQCRTSNDIVKFCKTNRGKNNEITKNTVFIGSQNMKFGISNQEHRYCLSRRGVMTWNCSRPHATQPWSSAAVWGNAKCSTSLESNGHLEYTYDCCPNIKFKTDNLCQDCNDKAQAETFCAGLNTNKRETYVFYNKKDNLEFDYQRRSQPVCIMVKKVDTYRCNKKKTNSKFKCKYCGKCKATSDHKTGELENFETNDCDSPHLLQQCQS